MMNKHMRGTRSKIVNNRTQNIHFYSWQTLQGHASEAHSKYSFHFVNRLAVTTSRIRLIMIPQQKALV